MSEREELLSFLQNQKFLVLGTTHASEPWVANVFYGIDTNFTIYFISSLETTHSKNILENPSVAFSTVWFNPNNHEDRKGVQGTGTCEVVLTEDEARKGVRLHNMRFPEFKNRITLEKVLSNENHSRVWTIKPKTIKFWNDASKGEQSSNFSF